MAEQAEAEAKEAAQRVADLSKQLQEVSVVCLWSLPLGGGNFSPTCYFVQDLCKQLQEVSTQLGRGGSVERDVQKSVEAVPFYVLPHLFFVSLLAGAN